MRKLFLIAAGALTLALTSATMMGEAQAQPYPYGYRPPPPRGYAPPPPGYRRPYYRGPACVTRSQRVWNGYRYVWVQRRVCR